MTRAEAIKVLKKELQIIEEPRFTMTVGEWGEHDDRMRVALDMAIDVLEKDCVEIVRCKDCKYSRVYLIDSNEEPQRWCKVGLAKAVDDDDYCSWGEMESDTK